MKVRMVMEYYDKNKKETGNLNSIKYVKFRVEQVERGLDSFHGGYGMIYNTTSILRVSDFREVVKGGFLYESFGGVTWNYNCDTWNLYITNTIITL